MKHLIFLLLILLNTGKTFAQKDSARFDSLPIFIDPEILPSFPGGDHALYAYISSNLKFPTCFREENLGTVYISFVIEKDGNLTGIKIIRGIGVGFDEEAIRLIEQMPNWVPGSYKGTFARVRYNLPIVFEIL